MPLEICVTLIHVTNDLTENWNGVSHQGTTEYHDKQWNDALDVIKGENITITDDDCEEDGSEVLFARRKIRIILLRVVGVISNPGRHVSLSVGDEDRLIKPEATDHVEAEGRYQNEEEQSLCR